MPITTRKKNTVASATASASAPAPNAKSKASAPTKAKAKKTIAKKTKRKSVVVSPKNKPSLKSKSKQKPATKKKPTETLHFVTSEEESYVSENELSENVDTTVVESDVEASSSEVEMVNNPSVLPSTTRREILERELRCLKLQEELAALKVAEPLEVVQSKERRSVVNTKASVTDKPLIKHHYASAGVNNLGTYNGSSDLETFLSRFRNCCEYFGWNNKDQLFQLKNALVESAGYVVTEIGADATLEEIIQLLKLRFGNEHQMERFRAEMKGRRRRNGESLQGLYQDLCRLKSLAFGKTIETEFSQLYLRDTFLDALNDHKLRKLILIQEPKTMEEALRIASRLEAIDASVVFEEDKEHVRNRNRVHKLEQEEELLESQAESNKSENRNLKRQLAEMQSTLNNLRQDIVQQRHEDHPPVGHHNNNVAIPPMQNQGYVPRVRTGEQSLDRNITTRNRRFPERPLDSLNLASDNRPIVCSYCKEKGHWSRECPTLKRKKDIEQPQRQQVYSTAATSNTNRRTEPQRFYPKNNHSNMSVLTSPTKMRKEAYLEIRLRSRKICALLDTGCEHSVIGHCLIPDAVLEPTNQKLFTANGAELPLLGEINLEFRVHEHWTSERVVVTEALNDLILGIDWLKNNNCQWDFGRSCFKIGGNYGVLRDKESRAHVRRLFVESDIEIPAQQQTHIPVVATVPSLNVSGTWAVKPKAINREIIVASTVHESNAVNTFVRVINLSDKPRKFRKGDVLTEAELVEVIDEQPSVITQEFNNPKPKYDEDVPIDYSLKMENQLMKLVDQNSESNGNERSESDVINSIMKNIGPSLSPEQREEAIKFLRSNENVFSKSEFDLGRTGLVKHVIDTGNNRPFKQQLRRHPMAYLPVIDEHVENMLANDIIEKSSSPWASNVVLVRKSDGSLRFCIDYRHLNLLTSKDSYPLPKIDTCFDALGGAKYFSTLDLRSGYWQVENDPSTSDKTSFVTRKGTFKFKVLAFGLSNAPAIFQRLMDLVMAGLTWEICLVFLDDIIVMSKTFEQHLERLQRVFDRLRSANLKLKPSKCHFFQQKVKFLGSVVSEAGVEPDPEKVKTVAEWPIPRTLTELRAFVALASYYRRHVEGFAKIAKPLHDLTKKNVPFHWTEIQQEAFEKLRQALVTYPILATPLPEGRYVVDTDASNFALGAVLQQEQGGILRVIAYASRVLDSAEQSYCTTRKELLGIMFGLKTFRHYLLATRFLLRTDHAALTSLLRSPEPIGQQARWLDTLAEYNFEIQHRAGTQHGNSDSLSRRPCNDRKCLRSDCFVVESLTQESTIVPELKCASLSTIKDSKPEIQIRNRTATIKEKGPPDHGLSLKLLKEAQDEDPVLKIVIELLKEPEWKENVDHLGMGVVHLWSQRKSLSLVGNLLHRNFERADGSIIHQQVVVPRPLRAKFLHWVHDDPCSGHFGINRTQEKLQMYAYWPGWRKDVEQYVRRCDTCCRYRKGPRFHQGPLQNGIGLSPMQKFHVDLTGPHPRSKRGNVYLLTGICCFTKYLITVPLRDKSALSVAQALMKHVFLIHGAVELQIHDQGREFCNEVLSHLSRMLGIQDLRTTPYRPSANAAIERVHRTINAVFAKTVNQNLKDWCELADYVTFAYNTSRHTSTTFSPFYLMFLREPRVGLDLLLDKQEPAYRDFEEYSDEVRKRMQIAYKIVEEQLRVTFDRAKRRYDARVKAVRFKAGDYCYYYCPRILPGRGRKFRMQTSGPWKVIRVVNDVNYVIQKTPTGRILIVHVDRMVKFEGDLPPCWKNKNDVSLPTQGEELVNTGNGNTAESSQPRVAAPRLLRGRNEEQNVQRPLPSREPTRAQAHIKPLPRESIRVNSNNYLQHPLNDKNNESHYEEDVSIRRSNRFRKPRRFDDYSLYNLPSRVRYRDGNYWNSNNS